MINFKINNVTVEVASQLILNRNRKEKADFGSVTILNNREQRYEPFTRVEITSDGITEQYLIESDEPLQQKDSLWEHEITLIENIAILTTIFPVDRQFTRVPALTIRQVLDIYKDELRYYQSFEFTYEDNSLLETKIVNKEYTGQDFAAIVYDLFRRIDAIPRLTWADGWVLSFELYTEKGNALTVNPDNRQSSVNDIDYATEVITKTRNAINEGDEGIWFPSENGHVTPRSNGTKFTTSELQYELDSDISVIYEALSPDVTVQVTNKDNSGNNIYVGTEIIDIDIKKFIVEEEVYKALEDNYSYNTADYVDLSSDNSYPGDFYKQHCVTYKTGNNLIEKLYSNASVWVLQPNINHLANAIALALGDNVKNTLKAKIIAENPTIEFSDNWLFSIPKVNTEDIKLRIRYRPSRNITYISEKVNNAGFNKATIRNEQRDSSVELTRMLENSSVIVNRIGNKVINISEQVDSYSLAWRLGDYINTEWIATDIQYTLDKNHVVVTADFTKNFSNTDRETSITREPSAYVYTGKNIVSNYILREYLVLYSDTTEQVDDSNLTTTYKRVIMNMFDYNDTFDRPIRDMLFIPDNNDVKNGEAIHLPVMSSAGGNSIILHSGFRDARIAGNGLRNIDSSWYKKPIKYVDDDFLLKTAKVKFGMSSIGYKTDTNIEKFYPLVDETSGSIIYNELPIDKDPNDIFALTWQLIVTSDDNDIIIPNGFTKFNNLIKSYDTAPDLKIYSNTEKYDIFDKYATGTEVTGSVTLSTSIIGDQYIEVLDSLGDPIENWSLVIDGETILAANNSTSRVNYLFTSNRYFHDILTNINVDSEINMYINISSEEIQQINYIVNSDDIDLTVSISSQQVILDYIVNAINSAVNIPLDIQTTSEKIDYTTNEVNSAVNIPLEITSNIEQIDYVEVDLVTALELEVNVSTVSIREFNEVNTLNSAIDIDLNVTADYIRQEYESNISQSAITIGVIVTSVHNETEKFWDFLYSNSDGSLYPYDEAVITDNPDLSPGVDVNNYDIGIVVRAHSGELGTDYYWYEVKNRII